VRSTIALVLAALGFGCAEAPPRAAVPEEQVILLPGPDGKVGSVVVVRDGARQVLAEPYAASRISADGQQSVARVSEPEVRADYGAALGAMPARPATFLLYFVTGSDELTADSQALLQHVLEELKRRPSPEVVAIGHTDTVGTHEYNDRLALQRAERVRTLLVGIGIPAERIEVAGRGERELLVTTADEAEEPRNRRVEINVR
jgi:outer membrane protein OmpA-like peptidoglycan-associated protein